MAGIAVAALMAAGLRGFWWEPASLRNEHHELTLSRWPAACDGLTVALMADHHPRLSVRLGIPGEPRLMAGVVKDVKTAVPRVA